jgi:hypothetical protein
VVYDYLCYGKIPRYQVHLGSVPIYYAPYTQPRLYLFLLLGLPLLLIAGLRRVIRGDLEPDQRRLLLYLCLNIAFVALVGNALEVSENHRFRFTTDPLYVVLLGLVVQQWMTRRAQRASRAVLSQGDGEGPMDARGSA